MTISVAMNRGGLARRTTSARASARAFLGVSALLFVACAVATLCWCARASAMGGSAMMWTRMPGQTWPGAAVSFVTMWAVMMLAMMLPSFVAEQWRRRSFGWEALRVGIGYVLAWIMLGLGVFPIGATVAWVAEQVPALARLVPLATGVAVLLAGALELTAWKRHHLACCRDLVRDGWVSGVRLGLHCASSSAGLTAILLVAGVMDVRVMVAVTTAVTAERVAPDSDVVARMVGAAAFSGGILLIVRAVGGR